MTGTDETRPDETRPDETRPDETGPARCSAKGCRADAVWALRWNNPSLHTPERRKIWAACDAHRQHLETFLSSRGFLRDTVGIGSVPDPDGAVGR